MSKRFLIILLSFVILMIFAFGPVGAQENAVVILVIDDFTGVDLSSIKPEANQDTCAVSLETQAFATRGASAEPLAKPHGEVVYAELEQMIKDLNLEDTIELIKVDIHGFTTEAVAQSVAQAIEDQPADFYVANMSFVIIPCETISALANFESQLKDAAKNKDKNKARSVIQNAANFYDQTIFPVNSKKFEKQTGVDPMQDFFGTNQATIIPIASAGNFGLDYPFWPAAWDQVVSVSASTGDGFEAPSPWDKKTNLPLLGADGEEKGKKGTRISNFGEVMLPGEYASEFGDVIGTSFAAPRLSLVWARYLSAVGDAYCRDKKTGAPAMAYGKWDNLTLEEAVDKYCPDMQPYLP